MHQSGLLTLKMGASMPLGPLLIPDRCLGRARRRDVVAKPKTHQNMKYE